MRSPSTRIAAAFLAFLPALAFAEGGHAPSASAIMKKVDSLFRSGSSKATIEMRIKNPHWERTMRFKMWSEGLDRTLIVIEAPKKDAGTGTLRIGTEMWNSFPNAGKVMKVPPSMMMASWMGSDFTNDDLVKENTYEKNYVSVIDEAASSHGDENVVVSTAKSGAATVWSKVITRVRKPDGLPIAQDFYDEGNEKVRTVEFSDIKKLSGRQVPSRILIRPVGKSSEETELHYLDAEFDQPLGAGIFTLERLRKGR